MGLSQWQVLNLLLLRRRLRRLVVMVVVVVAMEGTTGPWLMPRQPWEEVTTSPSLTAAR